MKKRMKGSILVYVMILISFIFLLLSSFSNKILKSLRINKITDENLYYLSVGGLEKACDLINQMAEKCEMEIIGQFGTDIVYKFTGSDKYAGEFTLSDTAKTSISYKLEEKVKALLNSNYKTATNKYEFSYKLSFDDEKAEDYDLTVLISYAKNGIDSNTNNCFKITSYAKNLKTDVVFDSSCVLKPTNLQIIENYSEKSKPAILNSGLFCIGKIEKGEYNINGDLVSGIGGTFSSIVNADVMLTDRAFDDENNVYINSENNKFLDISDLSGIIINKANDLHLFSSAANSFDGVIISASDIYIDSDISINGSLIAGGNIYLNGNLNIIAKSDAIYDVFINDYVLKRKIFDYFKLSKFRALSKNTLYTKGSIESTAALKIKSIIKSSADFFYIDEYVAKKL